MAETLINKNQAGDGVFTIDTLKAGKNIEIEEGADYLIDSNTVAVWNFDDASTWATSSYGNITSTKTTNVSWSRNTTYHKFGEACLYATRSGSGPYIYFMPDNMSGDITVDFWFQTLSAASGTTGERKLETNFGDTSNWTCKVSIEGNSDTQTIYVQNSSKGTFSVLKVDNTWHHYAIERDATNRKLYIFLDGVIIVNTSISNATAASKFAIGFPTSGATFVFDELRISDIIRWYPAQSPFTPAYAAYTQEASGNAYYVIKTTQDLLQNTATGTDSLTILGTANTNTGSMNIGKNSSSSNYSMSLGHNATTTGNSRLAIGYNASSNGIAIGCAQTASEAPKASGSGGIAIGYKSTASGIDSIAIGWQYSSWYAATASGQGAIAIGSAQATQQNSLAIGHQSNATATSAIQIGTGTNNTANTCQILGTQVVNASGKIPAASVEGLDTVYNGNTLIAGDNISIVSVAGEKNYSIVGTLTNEDEVVSGFSTSSYVTAQDYLSQETTLDSFEYVTAVYRTLTTVDGCGLYTLGDSYGFKITVSGTNKVRLRVSFNGSSYAVDISTSQAISLNTKTWIKITYSSTDGYTVSTSTDGTTWTQGATSSSTARPYQYGSSNVAYIGLNGNTAYNGKIYLKDTYLNINGQRSWTCSTYEGFKNKVNLDLTTASGYDATKTQVLKNVNGTLTWVDEA